MFRNYIVNPSLSTNGQPIGGLKGFLQSLQKLIRETKPDQVVICWDGEGGSQRRKSQNKGYKEGRKPIRLNRDIRNLTENEEISNKIWQQTRLVEYLNELPIVQLMLPAVEADDIISVLLDGKKLLSHQTKISFSCVTVKPLSFDPSRSKSSTRRGLWNNMAFIQKTLPLPEPSQETSQTIFQALEALGSRQSQNVFRS